MVTKVVYNIEVENFQRQKKLFQKKGLSKKKWAALIILNLQENSNLLKFKYEQRRKR